MGQLGTTHRRSPEDVRREGLGAHFAARSRDDCDSASQGLLAGLQCIGRAAALLDCDGEIVGSNALAHPFLDMLARAGAGPGRGLGRSRSVHQRIRDMLNAAQLREAKGDAAVIMQPDGEMLIVRATALVTGEPRLFRRASVLVQVSRLGYDLTPDPVVLRAAFGLTATESEVALALVGGASASAIARDRAVALETIRSHLKTIFSKTGTRRQANLVALILQLRDIGSPG